jgi:hypothetical protein
LQGPPSPPPWVPRSPPPHLRCRRRSKVGWSGGTPPSGRGSKVGWQGRTLRVLPWGGTPGGVPCKVGLSTLKWLLLLLQASASGSWATQAGACRSSIDAKLILSRHGSSGLNTHHVVSFDPGGLPSTTYANLSAAPNAYIFRRGGLLWVLESTEVPRTTDTTQTISGFG